MSVEPQGDGRRSAAGGENPETLKPWICVGRTVDPPAEAKALWGRCVNGLLVILNFGGAMSDEIGRMQINTRSLAIFVPDKKRKTTKGQKSAT